MEYTRLIQAQLRRSELLAEARTARLAKKRRPVLHDRADQRTDPSPHLTTTTHTSRPAR